MWQISVPFRAPLPFYVCFHLSLTPFVCVTKIDLEEGDRPWTAVCSEDSPHSFVEEQILPWCEGWAKGSILPLAVRHTPVSCVLREGLRNVAWGESISYSEFAARSGNARAVRYLSSFLPKNPFPLVIPCHRVIKKDGSIGNYLAGQRVKQMLLQFETASNNFLSN
jgi:O-6-methylguanine DNA methyltransferase